MRKLNPKKPLVRETSVEIGGRPLILRAFPDHLELREKRRRKKSAVILDFYSIFKTGLGLQFLTPDVPAHTPAPPRRKRKTRSGESVADKFDLDKFELSKFE